MDSEQSSQRPKRSLHVRVYEDGGARLEFLGDAVLELAVTHFLYTKYPSKPEGDLTAYRAALVNTVSLAESAESIGLNDMLFLSKGERKDTGRARQIILANAFEALLGAIYLDQGYEAAEAFIGKHLYPKIEGVVEKRAWQDAKSRFQELAQDKRVPSLGDDLGRLSDRAELAVPLHPGERVVNGPRSSQVHFLCFLARPVEPIVRSPGGDPWLLHQPSRPSAGTTPHWTMRHSPT